MGRNIGRTLTEAFAVIALGSVCGLIANAVGDSGIKLNKDHLRRVSVPNPPKPVPSPPSTTPETNSNGATTASPTPDPTPAPAKTFTFIDHETAVEIYQGENYAIDMDVFVDARDDDHYLEGHIPGAYQIDHYRNERYLPDVLPVCQSANRVVVYCNGGECEDSQLVAEDLMLNGIDPARLFVYEGGITEWRANGLPVEMGLRLSGEIVEGGE